jgi:hypothetical protein
VLKFNYSTITLEITMSIPRFTPLTQTATRAQFNHSHWDGLPDFRTQDEFNDENPLRRKVEELVTTNIQISINGDMDSWQDKTVDRQLFRFLVLEDGQANQNKTIADLQDQVKVLSMQVQQLVQQHKDDKEATNAKLELKSREIERLLASRV